ncbi:MAG: hypothetical protein AB1489_40170, partial [Acidobacteriota bacterium]
ISFTSGDWAVVDPDGRFDTNNFETIFGLHWVVSDEPLKSLPLEIFMRDYYEPRLLQRILNGESFKFIRSLASLNRVQPEVRITKVEREANSLDKVSVTVEVVAKEGIFLREGKQVNMGSGAYNLRLFRDRQLVAQWPGINTDWGNELNIWRDRHKIDLDPDTGRAIVTFRNIQLPKQSNTNQVNFTAYAFNSDRVKSITTTPWVYILPDNIKPAKPQAYIITVGVNANRSGWNLDFAAKNAQDIDQLLYKQLSKQYEINSIQLLSYFEEDGFRVVKNQATKANIKAVLDLLAGRDVDSRLRQEVDKENRIRPANPDDLVILFVSSHGYADPQGKFYIVPYDTGEPKGITEELLNRCWQAREQKNICRDTQTFLQHCISSDDLANWWNGVDAGEMIMILDSCYSSSIPGKEFKPGPLGDSGFGQLSYDKQMRILCAAQPNKSAIANKRLGGSLLVKILVANSATTLSEWLQVAEKQVPLLYKELYPAIKNDKDIQTPTLFDFATSKQSIPLVLR